MVTPLMRDPANGRGRVYVRALRSHLDLEYDGVLDWYQQVGGDNFHSAGETVTAKYNDGRDVFLAGKWSHMLCLETDMIVPKDSIQKLLALDTDIAYALYCFRHLGNKKWNAARSVTVESWHSFSDEPDYSRNMWGSQVATAGLGMGCTLIRRSVLETLAFRYWPGVSCDWALACDAQQHGFTQACDLSAVCGHMTLTPSPHTIWPDVNEPELIRIEFPE